MKKSRRNIPRDLSLCFLPCWAPKAPAGCPGLLGKLGLGKLDSGDILLLLILFLLWREGDHFDLVLLLALAFLFLRDSDT